VYQGSNGKVYPLPFTDRIAETRTDHPWRVVWLENEYLRVMMLPEIGGRIHAIEDRTNGYDLIYNQPVIKPALVGLAGPWVSGGIEFNWPQHHRPSTFMPTDVEIERHADGSITVWLGEHDPMARMKGMHGVCLHPGRAVVELKARAYNRTEVRQTFLWWANVATRVHEQYQSFFPPDVSNVADHAKRAMSTYPLAKGHYYGVNYGARAQRGLTAEEVPPQFVPPYCAKRGSGPAGSRDTTVDYQPNDLSWYANIPVPTSYMCIGSERDFFGGYDHARRAGLIHVANHHIAPGKKQWTWGNHPFGYAWDRNLTDAEPNGEFSPYIEIMSGVYTDNQPDFSFLEPGETKTWSQYWYPIREIGPAQHANVEAALSLAGTREGRQSALRLGVAVTRPHRGATLRVEYRGKLLRRTVKDLAPDAPQIETIPFPRGGTAAALPADLQITLTDAAGRELIAWRSEPRIDRPTPAPATEPARPADVRSADELYVIGLHLDQYRHATRSPVDYWSEALRRDPGDARCNDGLGFWHLRRGEWSAAERHFRAAIARLTERNPNPADGAPYYHLGLCLRHRAEAADGNAAELLKDAYAAFYKATWNHAQQPAAFHALAELDCRREDWASALDHLDRALRANADNLRARNLKAMVLRRLDRGAEADALVAGTLALDPLDWWARHLRGDSLTCDAQTFIDVALDLARAGFLREARALLEAAPREERHTGTAPLIAYTAAWFCRGLGDTAAERRWLQRAAAAAPDYCFPSRLEDIHLLRSAIAANPRDARAPYYLGNLLYDRRRHEEAIALWEASARLDPGFPVVWRNLGIGYFNIRQQPAKARAAYEKAFKANPRDARLLYERDQLWKRVGVATARRLRELDRHPELVALRDDLTLERCALLNQAGRHEEARELLSRRRFQPWEGGEGLALGQHVRTHLALGRRALAAGDSAGARRYFEAAVEAPENLGEARHLLANQSDLQFWLGCALEQLGDREGAAREWTKAASFRGDFQDMSVRAYSEMTYWSARAAEKLGRRAEARALFKAVLAHARQLAKTPARIDYFATSLPTMLLFDDDLQVRQETTALFLEAQARLGLGEVAPASRLLDEVLRREPSHAQAADLRRDLQARAGQSASSGRKSGKRE
jgi:tetratricopeptide (TPR) repeat protein